MSVLKIRNENGEFVPFPEFQWAPIINTSATNSDIDTYSCNYINQFNGVVLYENAAGSNTTIELNETSANFQYIEIFGVSYSGTIPRTCYTKVLNPNNKRTTIDTVFNASEVNSVYITAELNINDNTINFISNISRTSEGASATGEMCITKVVGYR